MKSLPDIPSRIETERLYMRPYRAGDGPMYLAAGLRNRAHLARYEAGNPLMAINTVGEAEKLIQDLIAEWEAGKAFFWGAFDRRTDDLVAQIYVGLSDRDLPACEVGYFVDCDHEGQGYVTEALKAALTFVFEHLQAHRASLHCDETNVRSARVAERCGFTLEGHIREDKRNTDGALSGTLCYGLLQREFTALTTLSPDPRKRTEKP